MSDTPERPGTARRPSPRGAVGTAVSEASAGAAEGAGGAGGAGGASSRRRRARPGEGLRLRAEILAAAAALLEESGDESALTLRAVAARAGVTTPSVYLHFADKEALIGAVCLEVWEELDRCTREAAATTGDPYQSLRRRGAAFVRFGIAHPVQYRLLMMRQHRTEGGGPGREAAAACLAHAVEAVRPCIAAGVLHGDPERLGLRFLTALHGCVALYIAQPDFPWPADVDTLADEVTRMAGLGAGVLGRLDPAAPAPAAERFASAFDAFTRALGTPDASGVPDVPNTPDVSNTPGAPKAPNVPGTREAPASAADPAGPAGPER